MEENATGRLAGSLEHDECAPWCDHNPLHHTQGCTDSFCDSYDCWKTEQIIRPDFSVTTTPIVEVPEPPKMPTPAEMRNLRKQFVTIKHPVVRGCGHSLDMGRKPVRNCQSCWFAWFSNHKEVVDQLIEMHQADGDAIIIQLQGVKFFKRYTQFMSTLAKWNKEQEGK